MQRDQELSQEFGYEYGGYEDENEYYYEDVEEEDETDEEEDYYGQEPEEDEEYFEDEDEDEDEDEYYNQMPQSSQRKDTGFHSEFLDRLSDYPLTHYLREKYSEWKSSNRLLRFVLERLIERNLPIGLFLATPFTATLFGIYTHMGSPFLEKLDKFGTRQLDLWENSGLVLLPYLLLDRTLDITEGTLDYWLPARNRHTMLLEDRAEDVLTEEEYHMLEAEGKYLEAAVAKFKYLQLRVQNLASNTKHRMRERLAYLPLALPISDFIGARLLGALHTGREIIGAPGELIQILNQIRNNAITYGQNVGHQTLLVMHKSVDPILEFALRATDRLAVATDWTLSKMAPDNLRLALRRLFLLFRNFVTTGELNWKKVKKLMQDVDAPLLEHYEYAPGQGKPGWQESEQFEQQQQPQWQESQQFQKPQQPQWKEPQQPQWQEQQQPLQQQQWKEPQQQQQQAQKPQQQAQQPQQQAQQDEPQPEPHGEEQQQQIPGFESKPEPQVGSPNIQEERKRKSEKEILREEMGIEDKATMKEGDWVQGQPVGSQGRKEEERREGELSDWIRLDKKPEEGQPGEAKEQPFEPEGRMQAEQQPQQKEELSPPEEPSKLEAQSTPAQTEEISEPSVPQGEEAKPLGEECIKEEASLSHAGMRGEEAKPSAKESKKDEGLLYGRKAGEEAKPSAEESKAEVPLPSADRSHEEERALEQRKKHEGLKQSQQVEPQRVSPQVSEGSSPARSGATVKEEEAAPAPSKPIAPSQVEKSPETKKPMTTSPPSSPREQTGEEGEFQEGDVKKRVLLFEALSRGQRPEVIGT